MSECYKCGRTLAADQVECDPPCFGNPPEEQTKEDLVFAENLRQYLRNQASIDWDKVRTFEDLLEIAKTIFQDAKVHRESQAYQKLKRFLSDPDGQS